MSTDSPPQKCPKPGCGCDLDDRPDGTFACAGCGATFVNASAVELERAETRLRTIESRLEDLLRP